MAWTTPYTFTAGETLTAAKLNEQIRDNLNALAPVGSLHWRMNAATTVETVIDGFGLESNAASVLRATYGSLNTKLGALGYPFGSVDGTHMTMPDLQGRTPYAMAASGHADVDALGDSDGLTKTARSPKHNTSAPTLNNATVQDDVASVTGVAGGGAGVVGGAQSSVTITANAPGPGGVRPIDTIAYLVVGVMVVKF